MTPGARIAAAIAVLDTALSGMPLERALTGWARSSRYAGSGDRAAVRDLAYGAWRRRRSFAALGGAETGRGLILGQLRHEGIDPGSLMNGVGHAPPAPSDLEAGRAPQGAERHDLPDWLWPLFEADLADAAAPVAAALGDRAPVFLRVNLARISRDAAARGLGAGGIGTRPHDHVKTALEVTENPRKVAQSSAYLDGLVELQDASSQAAVLALPLTGGDRVLDFCAGGGGKSLAIAARGRFDLWAHDAAAARLADLGPRAARARTHIDVVDGHPRDLLPFDLVLVDAPCSGSGTWRRDPDHKWRLTPERLAELTGHQAEILETASNCVAPGGVLAYATCSVLARETTGQSAAFLARHPRWRREAEHAWLPGPQGDGFSLCILRRD